MEQGLYAQVVMILKVNSDDIKEKYKTKKYNFQGQSARTKHWFNIDHEWLKENFMAREPDFYKNYMILNLGVIQHTTIKNLEFQLVMQE